MHRLVSAVFDAQNVESTERRRTWGGRVYRIRDQWLVHRDGTRTLWRIQAAYPDGHGGASWADVQEGAEFASMPMWDTVKRIPWPAEAWLKAA